MTRVPTHSADPPGSAGQLGRFRAYDPLDRGGSAGPIERVMSTVIRRLSLSQLSNPKVAVTVSGLGLLLGMLVGATAPNTETLKIELPLSHLFPSLANYDAIAMALLYTGDVLACLGLAGMLWAHSQGWRPDPRRLLLVSAAIVAVMVCLTPVGSSDIASYAAYGRIAALGGNPYTQNPLHALGSHSPYTNTVGTVWRGQPSVYGPIATEIQAFAASIGGRNVSITIWILMILTGAVFIGVGFLLLKTSDDPVRATLFWVANPVIIQQLVSGGQLDTFVAAAALCAIQVGVSDRALRMAAEYTTGREQFGRPIGSFQAVQQRMADGFIDLEAIRWTTWHAAWLVAQGRPADRAARVAKFWAAEAGARIAATAQHVHGGIGIDTTYPLHRYFLWAKHNELTLGSATQQLVHLGSTYPEGRL